MEAKAFRWTAVERIAHDGRVQSVHMGGMYPQLVGASGMGEEVHQGLAVPPFTYAVMGQRRFPLQGVHLLAGTVQPVGGQREPDVALFHRQDAV